MPLGAEAPLILWIGSVAAALLLVALHYTPSHTPVVQHLSLIFSKKARIGTLRRMMPDPHNCSLPSAVHPLIAYLEEHSIAHPYNGTAPNWVGPCWAATQFHQPLLFASTHGRIPVGLIAYCHAATLYAPCNVAFHKCLHMYTRKFPTVEEVAIHLVDHSYPFPLRFQLCPTPPPCTPHLCTRGICSMLACPRALNHPSPACTFPRAYPRPLHKPPLPFIPPFADVSRMSTDVRGCFPNVHGCPRMFSGCPRMSAAVSGTLADVSRMSADVRGCFPNVHGCPRMSADVSRMSTDVRGCFPDVRGCFTDVRGCPRLFPGRWRMFPGCPRMSADVSGCSPLPVHIHHSMVGHAQFMNSS